MERPFIVHVNLSNILKDYKETDYTMYIDDTKMTIVYELIEWIQWIFSLTNCIYLTHENSVIHEFEDIKILCALKNIKVQNCDHFPCIHTRFRHLFEKLNFFVQWNGIKVPKLFLDKVNEITQKQVQKHDSVGVMMNGCSREEASGSSEVRKMESSKVTKLHLDNISTGENQHSENFNSNVCDGIKTGIMGSHLKSFDSEVRMNNSSKVQSVLSDENEFNNTPIKINKSEIKEIESLMDINLSAHKECNEDEKINKSNRKRLQSISDDKKINDNKIIKKGPKPFSLGEILTSLRSEFNTSSNNQESNTFSIEPNQQCSLSKGLINDQNFPNQFDLTSSKVKRKRVRKHKSKRLNSGDSKHDNLPPLLKNEGRNISGTVKLYTPPNYTKQSSHIRFPSDDEDFSETSNSESNKQFERSRNNLGKNNELVENEMQQSSLINKNEEALSVTQPNGCDKNESKVDDYPETNKEFSTLDKLIFLHEQKSKSDPLLEYLSEENQRTNDVSKTPDNYDFNLSTLKALKEKFPSPMVVERFY